MCWRSRGGAWPATKNGGGRVGLLVIPARGRRTWRDKARMSTVRVRGATRGVARKQEVALGAATASGGEARLGQIAGGVVRRGGGREVAG
jgi:hypothetical protein